MALFNSKNTEDNSITLTSEEAFAAVTIIAMNIDGINHLMEFKVIGMVLDKMRLFKSYSSESLKQMLQKLQKILVEKGIEPLYHAAVANIPQELIPTAFAIVVDIIMADNEVVEIEKDLLIELADSLKISQDLNNKIIEVMQIRNMG